MAFLIFFGGFIALYVIIEAGVKNGINNSIIGEYLKNKNEFEANQNSILKDDLDNK